MLDLCESCWQFHGTSTIWYSWMKSASITGTCYAERDTYGVVGQKEIYSGEFCRRPRLSFLCFLGVEGMLDSFWTEGTFNRANFFDCCREFALRNRKVHQYPGFYSVWILDGAQDSLRCKHHSLFAIYWHNSHIPSGVLSLL